MFDRNLKQRKQSDTEEGTCMVHIVSLEVNIVSLEERFPRSISNNSVIWTKISKAQYLRQKWLKFKRQKIEGRINFQVHAVSETELAYS